MYDVYLKNYMDRNGNYIRTETLLYSVPILDPENALVDPVVKNEMGKTGTFEFTVYPNHPFYACWVQMKTIMRVVYDGDTIFRGRVLTIDNTLVGAKKLHLEGDMAFLLDSVQEGTKKENREKITIGEYLGYVLQKHNEQMDEMNVEYDPLTWKQYKFNSNTQYYNIKSIPKLTSQATEIYFHQVDSDEQYRIAYYATQGAAEAAYQAEYALGDPESMSEWSTAPIIYPTYGKYCIFLIRHLNSDTETTSGEDIKIRVIHGDETDKKIFPGELPGYYSEGITAAMRINPDEEKEYGVDSWTTTMSALEELQKEYGGYFRTRYAYGLCYLDWLESYFNPEVNGQMIRISENLLELNSSAEVDNIFTALIPMGSAKGKELFIDGYKTEVHGENKRILVPQIVSEFTDAELNQGYHRKSDYLNAVDKYGIIYKTQKFDNATTQEELWNYAVDWIRLNYIGGLTSFDLTAVDMHHIDGIVEKYLIGERIYIGYPDMDTRAPGEAPASIIRPVTILSVTYNLHNPEKNQYSVGTPNSLINKTYGTPAKGGGGGGGGASTQPQEDPDKQRYEAAMKDWDSAAWTYIINKKRNSELYQQIVEEYGDNSGEACQNLTHAIWMRGPALQEDPEGKYSEILHNQINAIVVDGPAERIKLLGSVNPQLAQKAIEEHRQHMDFALGAVIDGYAHQLTIQEKLDLGRGPITDEALAYYNTYYSTNPKKTAITLGLEENYSRVPETDPAFMATLRINKQLYGGKSGYDPIGITTETTTNTVSATGYDGAVDSILSAQGSDGTGLDRTVLSDGINSLTSWYKPKEEGQTDPKPKTAEVDGQDGSATFVNPSNTDYTITINKPITYTDGSGQSHTLQGAVKASDFYLEQVGSFTTEFAAIDTLLADYAQINSLSALKAEIDEIDADYINASRLSTALANASYVNTTTLAVGGLPIGPSNIVSSVSGRQGSDGTVTLTFHRPGGGSVDFITFSKAALATLTSSWSGTTFAALATDSAGAEFTTVGSFVLDHTEAGTWTPIGNHRYSYLNGSVVVEKWRDGESDGTENLAIQGVIFDAGDEFNSVTVDGGSWNSNSFTAQASNGNTASSPAYFQLVGGYGDGIISQGTWSASGNNKYTCSGTIIGLQTFPGGATVQYPIGDITFDASVVPQRSVSALAATTHSGMTWDIGITYSNGSSGTGTLNASAIYSDARQGYVGGLTHLGQKTLFEYVAGRQVSYTGDFYYK